MKLKLKEIVDQIGAVKAQLATLKREEERLTGMLKDKGDGSYEGILFRCTVSTYERGTLDKDAVIAELGQKWVEKHTLYTDVTKCICVARTGEKVKEAA